MRYDWKIHVEIMQIYSKFIQFEATVSRQPAIMSIVDKAENEIFFSHKQKIFFYLVLYFWS